jgi:hypothetical protein
MSSFSLDLNVNCFGPDRASSIRIDHRLANGIQEVVGSIPIGSTKRDKRLGRSVWAVFVVRAARVIS